MNKINSLENISTVELYHAFLDAFSEYEIKIDLPFDKFEELLKTRSFSAEDSVGYFEKETLVGFAFIGKRIKDGKIFFYDVATGTRKQYQNQGVGKNLLAEIKKRMEAKNVASFSLEVLENNTPAINLYSSQGFNIKRKLNCYGKDKNIIAQPTQFETTESDLQSIDIPTYLSFVPSWQNDIQSYQNTKEAHFIALLREKNAIISYGIIHQKSGSILQLGIHPSYQKISVFNEMINILSLNTDAKKLVLSNVEDNSILDQIILQSEFKKLVGQFEMSIDIIS